MSILARYISKELLKTTLATTAIVLLIVGGGRLTYYLGQAVTGDISGQAALSIVLNIVPAYLSHILPMGVFIGLLVTLGRLSSEQELVVLEAAAISLFKLFLLVLIPVSLCAFLVLLLSTLVTPYTYKNAEEIILKEQRTSKFESIVPGRFHSRNQDQVIYADAINADQDELADVFVFYRDASNQPVAIKADSARQYFDETYQSKYLLLTDGSRVLLPEQSQAVQLIDYETMGVRYQANVADVNVITKFTIPTAQLFDTDNWVYKAQLYWRLSLPVMVLVTSLIGLALSRVKPRQGRFAKLIPALVLYLVYFYALVTFRNQLETGDTGALLPMVAVHGVFLLIGIYLLMSPRLKLVWSRYRRMSSAGV